ncbi:MAG: hypothetical protein O2890_07600, partial [Cyanobacteria bacterium]|nr:hypothetical protein [Cyanobacteriota bacterium]
LVLNLERWLRQLLTLLFWLYGVCINVFNRLIGVYGRSPQEDDERQPQGCWNGYPQWGKMSGAKITTLLANT